MPSDAISTTRRRFLAASATAGALGSIASVTSVDTLAAEQAGGAGGGAAAGDRNAIRPFHVHFPDAALADMKRRVAATRWPERETVGDFSQGVKLATMQSLAHYWAGEYDWRKCEARLNAVPNFVTEIDGLDIHFIHVRSKHPNALPIIITHGWPGSVIEQLKVIGPLTDPTAHGGTEADAFHVVIPSLPGHGFTAKTTKPGWQPITIAKAWAELMQRLGYSRYVAQGGDWGNAISEVMALQQPPGLLAISTNMAATVPANVSKALSAGGPAPGGLSPEEQRAWGQLDFFYKKGLGYASEMQLRPQSLYALADSPIGLASWMFDHDARSLELIARVFDGGQEGLSKQDVVDNVALYWLTNTAVSSARLYWEAAQLGGGGFFDVRGIKIPVAVSAYPDEIYTAPRTWAVRAYPKLLHYSAHDKGGHFAAWEQPASLTSDLRTAFGPLRTA